MLYDKGCDKLRTVYLSPQDSTRYIFELHSW
jgi:hypothetical protein